MPERSERNGYNYDLLKYTLDPKTGEIRLRFPCPNAFEDLYMEIQTWIEDPKKFIRDYTIEYMDAVLKHEKIEVL